MVIELLTLALLGQVPIPSMTVPPTSEKSVVFMDRGRVYLVGVESGNVRVLDNLPAPNPTPDDDDTPEPTPTPISLPWKWATIVIDRNDPSRNAWKDAVSIRDVAKSKGGTLTFLGSDEKDIDTRNLRSLVTERGLPLLVLWDAERKPIASKKVETEAELLEALK